MPCLYWMACIVFHLIHLSLYLTVYTPVNVLAKSIHSRVRHTELQDTRHLYMAEPRASEPWSPELVEDFRVMHYDREHGSVLGYQESTGQVFAQHSPTHAADRHHETLHLTQALVLGLTPAKLGGLNHMAREPAEFLAVDVTVTDTVQWRAPPCRDNQLPLLQSHDHWHYTWEVSSPSTTGDRVLTVHSNARSELACACQVVRAKGLWRTVPGVAKSIGCVVVEPLQALATEHRVTLRSREDFCRRLQAQLSGRTLLVVPNTQLSRTGCDSWSCWAKASKYLGKQHVTKGAGSAPERSRQPRAQLLADVKFGMRSLAMAQTMLSAISLDVEAEVMRSLQRVLRHKPWATRLYSFAHSPPSQAHALLMETVLNRTETELQEAVAENRPMSSNKPRTCDAQAQAVPHLAQLTEFLATPRTSLTPESANTTLISMAFAHWVVDTGPCLEDLLATYGRYARCIHSGGGLASAQVGPSAPYSVKAIAEMLRNPTAILPNMLPMDRADWIVGKVMDELQALLQHTNAVAVAHSRSQAWARQQEARYTEATGNATAPGTPNTRHHASGITYGHYLWTARAWCCSNVVQLYPFELGECVGEVEQKLWQMARM